MPQDTRMNGYLVAALIASLFLLLVGCASPAQGQSLEPEGQLMSIGGVGFMPPKGWSVKQTGTAAVMIGPVPQGYQPCLIAIDPTVRPVGDMAEQLEAIVNADFGRQFGPYRGEDKGDVKADQYQGVAAAGWPYVDLLGQLGNSQIHVRALLARFNDRAVAVMGVFATRWAGSGPMPPHAFELASNCLGSPQVRDNDVFLRLFHSLQLPGFSGASNALARQVLGSWQRVSGGAGVRVSYAANGHFDDGGVKANYYVSGNGTIYDVPTNVLGNGMYRIDGDRLTMNRNGQTQTKLVSVVRRPKRDQPGAYEEILRQVEQTDSQVWGFGQTGYFVISYSRSN
jgi:hypothetical protein